jgi:UDP-N-acetyl-D-mannosaminuronic acid transferase (WecB/TagA/CpsF family)
MRLEWAYRLMREPARLAGRYLVGNPLFLWRVMLSGLSGYLMRDGR